MADASLRLSWFLARRYLASRRGTRFLSLITAISIAGVAVGVLALVVVTSVMNGLQTELRDKILGTNPHIWVTQYGEAMRLVDWPTVAARVRRVDGVVAAAPFVHAEVGMTNAAGHAEFVILRGVEPRAPGPPVTDLHAALRRGQLRLGPTRSGLPPLLVGSALGDRFGLAVGDRVTVLSPQGAKLSPFGALVPKMQTFEVVGRFRTGMYEYDNKFAFTTLAAAQQLLGLGTAVTGLEVRVRDPLEARRVAARLDQALGFPYYAQDWTTLNGQLFSALKLEKLALALILLLIVVVAAFNIVSTLVMMVTDKTKEIGILKAMGMGTRAIRRVFLLQGFVIGAVGSTVGAALGLLVVWVLDRYRLISIPGDVYFIDYLPVAFEWTDLALILLAAWTISLLATIYPARQAARLVPIEAIRHE
jgi:lipoprotein-releasing system permease protein